MAKYPVPRREPPPSQDRTLNSRGFSGAVGGYGGPPIGTLWQTFSKIPDPSQPPARNTTSRVVTVPTVAAGGTTYNDSASGTITLSGAVVEAFAVKPPTVYRVKAVETTQVNLGPRIIKATRTYNDTASGTITLSGSASDIFTVIPPKVLQAVVAIPIHAIRLGSRFFRPPAAQIYNDSASGTITLSGSSAESFSVVPHQQVLKPVSQPQLDARSPRSQNIQGLVAGRTTSDSQSGTITLSGSAVEQFGNPQRFTVSVQGQGNLFVTQGVPRPVDPNEKIQQPVPFFGYYSAPPIYQVVTQGASNQGYQFRQVPQPAPYSIKGSRFFRIPGNNDFATGTITLSGSGSDSFIGNTFSNVLQVDPNHPVYVSIGDR